MSVQLLGGRNVQELCRALELRPSKKRGQNFVTDPGTVRRIAQLAIDSPDSGTTVLEIGPGLGSLTLALLEAGARVIAVEIDSRLAQALEATCQARGVMPGQLRVLHRDALTIQSVEQLLEDSAWDPPTVLASNLPYNVATPLLLHCLEALPSLRRAVNMVQAEVADRWVARPGEAAYGAPSVKLAWWGRSRRVFDVGRNVFYPVPNVDSAVVDFSRHPQPPFPAELREAAFAAVKAAFGQRRKTLRQSLSDWAGSPAQAEQILEACGIDARLRAERLDVADFARLAAVFEEKG